MNINTVKKVIVAVNCLRTIPVYLCVKMSTQRKLVEMDISRWFNYETVHFKSMFFAMNWLLSTKPEYRNLILHRLKNPHKTVKSYLQYYIVRLFWKPLDSLYLCTEEIGGGFYIQHGFSSIVAAKRIGEYCMINQQVTIGYKGKVSPILEDHVSVTCGAIVVGDVTIHSNSKVGAGAVVVKDVPPNTIVAGVPATIIKHLDQ